MAEKLTRVCYSCKNSFPKEEMIQYAGLNAKILHWYCKKCYEEKTARENFSVTVCKIFGLKSPGPRIWREREALMMKYGYTDNTIIDCLEYVYNVEKKKKLSESLYFVTPPMVEKAKKWKKSEEYKAMELARATQTVMHEEYVPAQENTQSNKRIFNADDFLIEE